MKKLFVVIGVFLTLLSLPVSAEEPGNNEIAACEAELNTLQGSRSVKYYPSMSAFSFVDIYAEHKDYIAGELRKLNKTVDISDFEIPVSEFQTTVIPLARDTINENPDLFYIGNTIKGYYNKTTGMLTSLEFEFYYEGEELAIRTEKFNEAVNQALSVVDDSMTDFEKLLVLHDYLATTAEYNMAVILDKELGDKTPEAWSAYGVLVDKIGVCHSYTMAYEHLLNLLGIESGCALSESMNHIWNIVSLDGNYYHVDITWDDPVFGDDSLDYFGVATHAYFLISDEGIMADSSHYDWIKTYDCTDTSFDSAWFRNVNGLIALDSENFYYSTPNSIQKYDKELKVSSVICNLTQTVRPFLFLYDGKLYFNTPEKIKTLDVATGLVSDFYEYKGDKGDIYGVIKDGNSLFYCIGNAPLEKNEILSIPLGNISASKTDNTISITLKAPYNIEGQLVLSLFDENNNIIASGICNASANILATVNTNSASYAKILWWDFIGLKPHSESLKLNL